MLSRAAKKDAASNVTHNLSAADSGMRLLMIARKNELSKKREVSEKSQEQSVNSVI